MARRKYRKVSVTISTEPYERYEQHLANHAEEWHEKTSFLRAEAGAQECCGSKRKRCEHPATRRKQVMGGELKTRPLANTCNSSMQRSLS
jgi:hypothetical protein